MAIFAIVENKNVINVVIADDPFPLTAMFPAAEIIEQTTATGYASVGGTYSNGKFRVHSPFKSWRWNSDMECWLAPVPVPTDIPDDKFCVWSETDKAWHLESFVLAPAVVKKK